MLEPRILRELVLADDRGGSPLALSAASGLVRCGSHVFVVADDELQLARFDLEGHAPGQTIALFNDAALPAQHAARKAAKPDCEALLKLPPLPGLPHGALLALGSGSRPARERGALLALDARGETTLGPARGIDLSALFAPLHDAFAELNIEGAFVAGERLCLLQRGNGRAALNARIEFDWPACRAWLSAPGHMPAPAPVPAPATITPYTLGTIDGVPLSFTDGAALPGGGWLFSAAAEDTTDPYLDGACLGSVIGRVDAAGALVAIERLSLRCKVEGIAARAAGDTIELLMVTDADDRSRPALLLAATLRLPGPGSRSCE